MQKAERYELLDVDVGVLFELVNNVSNSEPVSDGSEDLEHRAEAGRRLILSGDKLQTIGRQLCITR